VIAKGPGRSSSQATTVTTLLQTYPVPKPTNYLSLENEISSNNLKQMLESL